MLDMRDWWEFGPTPCDEECAQVGSARYAERATAECERFIALLRRKFGPPPDGAHFRVKAHRHDFGTYYEVALSFYADNEAHAAYALRVDNNLPTKWYDDAEVGAS